MSTELTPPIANATLADADVVMGFFNNLEGRLSESFAQDTPNCAGLTWAYKSGRIRQNDGTVVQFAGGSVTLAPTATNYIEIDGYGNVTVNAARSLAHKPIRKLVTDSAGVLGGLSSSTNNLDERAGFDFSGASVLDKILTDAAGNVLCDAQGNVLYSA